jgi:hypothetical protein
VLANGTSGDLLDATAVGGIKAGFGCTTVSQDVQQDTNSRYAGIDLNSLGPFGFTSSATPARPNIKITLRSSLDPYVTALRLTGGNPRTFGLTTREKLSTGFALLGLGLAMFAIPACLIMAVVRGLCGKRSVKGAVGAGNYGGPSVPGYGTSYPQQQAQGYPQQQAQGYPQQQVQGYPGVNKQPAYPGTYAPVYPQSSVPSPYDAYQPGAQTPYQPTPQGLPGGRYPTMYPSQPQQQGGYPTSYPAQPMVYPQSGGASVYPPQQQGQGGGYNSVASAPPAYH